MIVNEVIRIANTRFAQKETTFFFGRHLDTLHGFALAASLRLKNPLVHFFVSERQ